MLAAFVACTIGCALVPGVPAGPIRSPGVRAGVAYAYAYGRASAATRQFSGEPYTLRRNSAMFRGLVPFFPIRALLRASPASFMDVGLEMGWTDAALQLRAGQLDARRSWPWGIELEGRTGKYSPFDGGAQRTRVVRARAELYPALGTAGQMDGFGVLTLGASTGRQFHYMFVPQLNDDDGLVPSALEVTRVETRLEASFGVHGRVPRAAFTIAVQPWLTVDARRPDWSNCHACSLELERLSAPWGIALVASGNLVWDGH
jgi:hypothetical protein